MICEGLDVLTCEGEIGKDEGFGAERAAKEGGEGGESCEEGWDWFEFRRGIQRLFMREVRVGEGVIEVGNVGFTGMRCVGKGRWG